MSSDANSKRQPFADVMIQINQVSF